MKKKSICFSCKFKIKSLFLILATISIVIFIVSDVHRVSRRREAVTEFIESKGGIVWTGTCGGKVGKTKISYEEVTSLIHHGDFNEQFEDTFLEIPDFSVDLKRDFSHNLVVLALPGTFDQKVAKSLRVFKNHYVYLDLTRYLHGKVDLKQISKSVRYLDLKNSKLDDYTFLSELENLKALNLQGSSIKDLAPLSNLQFLENLNARDLSTKIKISPLSQLANLRCLQLDGTSVIDTEQLAKLEKLESLTLGQTRERDLDISFVSNLGQLKYLSVVELEIANFEVISQSKRIEKLDLIGSVISEKELDAVLELPCLKQLNLSGVPILGKDQIREFLTRD